MQVLCSGTRHDAVSVSRVGQTVRAMHAVAGIIFRRAVCRQLVQRFKVAVVCATAAQPTEVGVAVYQLMPPAAADRRRGGARLVPAALLPRWKQPAEEPTSNKRSRSTQSMVRMSQYKVICWRLEFTKHLSRLQESRSDSL